MNTINFFRFFKDLVIYCKSVNQSILEYEEDQFLHLLKNYTIFPINTDLNAQLDTINGFCDLIAIVDENKTERNQNNKKILRLIILMYYRLLNRYLINTGNILNYEDPKLLIRKIGYFITNMTDEEKQNIYKNAENDLKYEVAIIQNDCSIVTLLKRVIRENDVDSPLVNELESYCSEKNLSSVLYPSCYSDLSDVDYFINFGNNIFSPHHLFIHVDFWNDIYNDIEFKFGHENVDQETYITTFSDQSKVTISKINFKENIYWFIFFSGTRNEQILQELIYNKVNVETIISKCDGITSGMGHSGFSISTPLYICFYNLLHIKRIITEYNRNYISNLDQNWKADMVSGFIDWLANNLNHEDSHLIIEEIQNKSYDQIIEQGTEEYPIYEANGLNYFSDNDFRREFVCWLKVNQ
jgi:hypothetical protein